MLAQEWPLGCQEDIPGKVRETLCPQEPLSQKSPRAGEGDAGMRQEQPSENDGVSPLVVPSGAVWSLAEEDPPFWGYQGSLGGSVLFFFLYCII